MIYFFVLTIVLFTIWLVLKIYSKKVKPEVQDDYDFVLVNPPFGEDWDRFEG